MANVAPLSLFGVSLVCVGLLDYVPTVLSFFQTKMLNIEGRKPGVYAGVILKGGNLGFMQEVYGIVEKRELGQEGPRVDDGFGWLDWEDRGSEGLRYTR